jgi:signal transduction histidine kinase
MRTLARAANGGEWQPERLRKLLLSADRQVTRLSQLIDELLDVSRINIGKLQIEKEPVDLAKLCEEIVQRFCEEFTQGPCPLRYSYEGPVLGEWDRFRLEQVIINLITNAMKYGEGKPVDIRVREEQGQALISVRDYGIGISPDDQQRIFERFERAVSSSHFGGLGLGLYIVREILRAHGGQIRVRSEKGGGSEFEVELPVRTQKSQNPRGAA